MAIKKIEDSIASLEAKLKQKRAALAAAESRRRAAESKRARADDTRRKVLIGAVTLGRVARGEWTEAQLTDFVAPYLTRDDDRALFNLAPLQVVEPSAQA